MTKFLDATGVTRLIGGIINEKRYSNLETTNKTISGAINELKRAGDGGDAIVLNIDEDYVTPNLTQNTKLYFTPSQDRSCDITVGGVSVGTKLFLYHSGSGNFKVTVTYAMGKTFVLTRKMYAELECVPDGWMFVRESCIGQMDHGYIIPRGAVELAGQLRDKSDALWHYITEYYSALIVTEAAWRGGDCLKFVDYSDTAYRLPDFRGIFERNAGENSVLKTANGTAYSGGNPADVMLDMMQGHRHNVGQGIDNLDGGGYKAKTIIGPTSAYISTTLDPVSDGTNDTPRKGNQTQPVSGSKYAFIYTEDCGGTSGGSVIGGEETPAAIVTNIDEDYVTPILTQNTKLYFTPSQDRSCDITAGAVQVGTKLFLYHSGSGNFKETVTYATGKTLVLTQKMFYELESVPGGWLITDSNSKDFIDWNECPYSMARNAEISATYHIYEFIVTGDKTEYFHAGMKIKLTQSTVKYGIITYVETSGGNTILTVYGGTDYAFTNDAMSNIYIAKVQKPIGNTWSEDKWSISYSISYFSKSNATINVYYYTGNTFKIFKGGWIVDSFITTAVNSGGALSSSSLYLHLSKSQSSVLDSAGDMYMSGYITQQAYLNDRKIVNLTSDTDYYVIIKNGFANGHLISIGSQSWNRIILTPASL